MSELNYKELQEQGVFDVPYRAFEFMRTQQTKIDQLKAKIDDSENTRAVLYRENMDIREKTIESMKRVGGALVELEALHNKKWSEWKDKADMHSQGEANAYEHSMLILEKALRGEHEDTN